jgi:hypothetical protein
MASKAKQNVYLCGRLDAITMEPCRHTFGRKFNLQRHIDRKHKEKTKNTFIQYVPNNQGDLQKTFFRDVVGTQVVSNHSSLLVFDLQSSQSPLSLNSSRVEVTQPSSINTTVPPPVLLDTHLAHDDKNLSVCPPSNAIQELPQENAPSIALSHDALQSIDNSSALTDTHSTWLSPWAQRRDKIRKRLWETLEKDSHPVYQVKRSKKWPLQQRAIDWLTQAGKLHFDSHFATILAQWGVKETHTGTCILLPADWAALDPLRLAGLLTSQNCPLAWADKVVQRPSQLKRSD